ncbi:hypothetical protein llap_12144 [Limosa lapponica baueri]|uniref:Uncharacterized protein n=1 Tax=Limosa lapponica baueri TaxID=1758121 RepID=A0A2I0TUU9_LIMLA|nr:hypothetical protein llap_12144 [Limosa lapponica baueri]
MGKLCGSDKQGARLTDVEKSFFGIKESLGYRWPEIAQIHIELLHHPCGSSPKQASAAEDHNKADVKQHRSGEQGYQLA